ncbi:serine/arginine-rich SC35-like splicing factor SCL30 isoform X2 [Phragmites australis]|uniref:serine/arginine-rich SC35-like splicing factor SCL30 isoform X2 n=1 Tax=Phragmites australis TaxID=29695 RepID=UPI002D78CBCE|nr:serine/arginine-rich SC35-like splicing factor SCL30 isoform X2 [Phragmites australis]
MRRYSPPRRSPPRRGYGGRGRSPPPRRGGYGGRKEQGSGSLLVRNIPLSVRVEDLRVPFERFGPVRDVYIPKDYYSGEPRGFAFVEFVDPYDASEAQYHMNRQVCFGREITVVLAAESRKRPEEMRGRDRVRGYSGHEGRRSSYYGRSRSRSRSPRYRGRPRSGSYSPCPRRRDDYSASPRRKEAHRASPPRRQPKEHDEDKKQRSYSPASRDDAGNGYEKSPPRGSDGSPRHRRSPREHSGSPPGSRSRSADGSPACSD